MATPPTRSPARLGDNIVDRVSRLSIQISDDTDKSNEQDSSSAPLSSPDDGHDDHRDSESSYTQALSEPGANGPMLSPPSPIPVTAVYVVTKASIVRTGPAATIEAPAIRSETLAVCLRAERAREVAKKAWRQTFAYAIPDGKTEEFDAVGLERLILGGGGSMKGSKGVEVFRLANRRFVSAEDGVEVLEGERRVGVWRVGVDCEEANGEGEECLTPVSD